MPIPSFCLEYFVERIWLTFDRRIYQTSLYNRAIPTLSIIRHGIAVRTKSLRSIFHRNLDMITSLLLPSCWVFTSEKRALAFSIWAANQDSYFIQFPAKMDHGDQWLHNIIPPAFLPPRVLFLVLSNQNRSFKLKKKDLLVFALWLLRWTLVSFIACLERKTWNGIQIIFVKLEQCDGGHKSRRIFFGEKIATNIIS